MLTLSAYLVEAGFRVGPVGCSSQVIKRRAYFKASKTSHNSPTPRRHGSPV
jgi:hypothetical protein